MKFGAELHGKIYGPWRQYYLGYNELKLELKQRQLDHGWRERDELEFTTAFEKELEKVYTFIDVKLGNELERRVAQCEQTLANISTSNGKAYDAVADSLTEILFDVNDLGRFLQLNLQGFDKLVKKHDRWTHLDLRTRYSHQLLVTWPLERMQQRFDVFIVRISHLHDVCLQHGQQRQTETTNDDDPNEQTEFERATAKYWVHPENINEVKSIILFHLPVHVYNKKKTYEASDAAISSVYFDNPSFDLYKERLERSEGAEAIRFRWYGNTSNNIYIERKTHHAPWLNGHSVKDRFPLKEPVVDRFMHGQYTDSDLVADLRQKARPVDNATIEHQQFVASGIQKSIQTRHLKPMCRVYYQRTAFQRAGDQRLRISLDCNMTFVREDELDGVKRANGHWRRKDADSIESIRQLRSQDVHYFPYAVLETKIQSHLGQETPEWLTALLTSHLVYEVPRFSKYLHGASQLFAQRLTVLPWWLSELNKDIRKPPVLGVGLSRSLSLRPLINGHHRQSLLVPAESQATHLAINLSSDKRFSEPKQLVSRDTLSRFFERAGMRDTKKGLPLAVTPKRTKSISARILPMKKTEPKTFFANERTFISWLQFCALLLTVALNLLNYGDHISRVIGAVFIIMSSVLCFYALGRFQFRAWQLRTGRQIIRYDDIYGPTVLCICLVTALLINFYLRATSLSETPSPAQSVIKD